MIVDLDEFPEALAMTDFPDLLSSGQSVVMVPKTKSNPSPKHLKLVNPLPSTKKVEIVTQGDSDDDVLDDLLGDDDIESLEERSADGVFAYKTPVKRSMRAASIKQVTPPTPLATKPRVTPTSSSKQSIAEHVKELPEMPSPRRESSSSSSSRPTITFTALRVVNKAPMTPTPSPTHRSAPTAKSNAQKSPQSVFSHNNNNNNSPLPTDDSSRATAHTDDRSTMCIGMEEFERHEPGSVVSSQTSLSSKESQVSAHELLERAQDRMALQKLQDEVAVLNAVIERKNVELQNVTGQLRRAVASKCDLVLAHTELERNHEQDIRLKDNDMRELQKANFEQEEVKAQVEMALMNEIAKVTQSMAELEQKHKDELDDWERMHRNEMLEKDFQNAKLQEELRISRGEALPGARKLGFALFGK